MARDYTKIKAWQLADELALLAYKTTKEFSRSEIGLISYIRKVWCLMSEVQCLKCSNNLEHTGGRMNDFFQIPEN